MAEYIDRKKIRYHFEVGEDTAIEGRSVAYKTMIDSMPTEDVVPVVRCSQCQKRYTTECALWFSQLDDKQYFCGAIHNDDFYCSYGERKD